MTYIKRRFPRVRSDVVAAYKTSTPIRAQANDLCLRLGLQRTDFYAAAVQALAQQTGLSHLVSTGISFESQEGSTT